jgi:hypothetical protein
MVDRTVFPEELLSLKKWVVKGNKEHIEKLKSNILKVLEEKLEP